ncbi:MAG: BatD family protein [Pirellulales bacterium]
MAFRYLYIGMLLAVLPGLAAAAPPQSVVADGPVKVNARVDRETAQVAEPIRLTLTVEAPQGTRVELPQLGKQLGDYSARGIERTEDIPVDESGKQRQWSLSAVLDTVKTGAITIPPLEVHYATDAKSPTFKSLATKPIKVAIQSVLENRADPTKFRDIKETVDVALPANHSYAWLGWTAAGVGGAVAVALATLAIVKRKQGPSPAEWALTAIADLRQLPIASSADAEAAYNEIVDVIREYVELEFNLPVLAKTTREFLTETTKLVKLEPTTRERLGALASIADEIKFARLGVGEPQVRQALDQAEAFIHECEVFQRAARKEAA